LLRSTEIKPLFSRFVIQYNISPSPPHHQNNSSKQQKQQTPNPKPQRGLVGYLKNPAPEPSKRVSGSLGTLEATSGVFGLVHNLWTLGLGALRSSLSYFACSGKIGGSKSSLAPTHSEIPLGGPFQRPLPPAKRSFVSMQAAYSPFNQYFAKVF